MTYTVCIWVEASHNALLVLETVVAIKRVGQ
jgi:hypothetical protein